MNVKLCFRMRPVPLVPLFVAAVVLCFLAGCEGEVPTENKETPNSDAAKVLPKPEEIDGMKAYLAQPKPVIPRFDVPKAHWGPILKSLASGRFDPKPAKWEVLGYLDVTKKNGDSLYIGLYYPPGNDVAFKIGVYYRGGNSATTERLIREAYADFQKRP